MYEQLAGRAQVHAYISFRETQGKTECLAGGISRQDKWAVQQILIANRPVVQ
jgi:hypothetical protein